MTGAPVQHRHWGRVAYRDALARQQERWRAVIDGVQPEAVFTLEHDPVVTLGRRGRETDLRVPREVLEARGVDLIETDRGGELTYHGPGQLVVYPILAVGRRRIHASDLVRGLAAAVNEQLAALGIESRYDADAPGLWTDSGKIAAVGMRISRGVSMHGTAVNLSIALDAFDLIVPCGLPEARTTSVEALLGSAPPLEAFGRAVVESLATRFDLGPLG